MSAAEVQHEEFEVISADTVAMMQADLRRYRSALDRIRRFSGEAILDVEGEVGSTGMAHIHALAGRALGE